MEKKTRADIDELKANWLQDPTWDIEDTEGFEAHIGELYNFRMQTEARQRRAKRDKVEEVAKETYCEDKIRLIQYIVELENRIARLEKLSE